MICKGMEFAVVTTEAPGIWRWQFTVNRKTRKGWIEAGLALLAIRRVKLRIDRELKEMRRSRTEDG